jgi:type IV pilus assembly protein PilA
LNRQQGFTLIELMIVVAIIAILAAIAIPVYQEYITKAQFSESQVIADGLKQPVTEYYNINGGCPDNTGGAADGLSAPASYAGKYVSMAAASKVNGQCAIAVVFKGQGSVSKPLAGKTVYFLGKDNGGTFSWSCDPNDASTIPAKYKPLVCRS